MCEIKRIDSFTDSEDAMTLLENLYEKRKRTDEIREELKEMFEKYHYMLILAFIDGKPVGVCGLSFNMLLYTGKFVQISNLYVLPEYRKAGIAAKLIGKTKDIARENNISSIMLDSYTTNFNSHKTYFREGFRLKAFHFILDL